MSSLILCQVPCGTEKEQKPPKCRKLCRIASMCRHGLNRKVVFLTASYMIQQHASQNSVTQTLKSLANELAILWVLPNLFLSNAVTVC